MSHTWGREREGRKRQRPYSARKANTPTGTEPFVARTEQRQSGIPQKITPTIKPKSQGRPATPRSGRGAALRTLPAAALSPPARILHPACELGTKLHPVPSAARFTAPACTLCPQRGSEPPLPAVSPELRERGPPCRSWTCVRAQGLEPVPHVNTGTSIPVPKGLSFSVAKGCVSGQRSHGTSGVQGWAGRARWPRQERSPVQRRVWWQLQDRHLPVRPPAGAEPQHDQGSPEKDPTLRSQSIGK